MTKMTRNKRTPASGKVVIFDLGNVVLDWNIERILGSLEAEAEAIHHLRNELFIHQNWLDLDHGKESEASVVSKVCANSPLSKRTVEQALLAAKNSLEPIEESVALLREISDRGIAMYCLSNMSRETWAHIRGHALFDLFSGIVISGIERCMKPDEAIFHLILGRYDLDPAHTLFIDDSLPNIETAERLGTHVHHFKRSRDCYAGIRAFLFE